MLALVSVGNFNSKGPMSGSKPSPVLNSTHDMHSEPSPSCILKYITPWSRSFWEGFCLC